MESFWLYILLGFLGGMIFCFLLIVGFVKKLISMAAIKSKENE